MSYTNAQKIADIPQEPHWAIIVFGSIHIPGDERSRTHPGHGYPESTEVTRDYLVFTSEAEWVAEVERRAALVFPRNSFVAIKAHPAKITTRTVVEVIR